MKAALRACAGATVLGGLCLLVAAAGLGTNGCATAPQALYEGPGPPVLALADTPRTGTEAPPGPAAPAPVGPDTPRVPRSHHLGTLQLANRSDSIVLLIAGDNRPGLRLATTRWGLTPVRRIANKGLGEVAWGILNIPVLLVQTLIPSLDGPRDVAAVNLTHLYTGGREGGVIKALMNEPGDVVINTGDLVEEIGRAHV